jgi:hypothetical protein
LIQFAGVAKLHQRRLSDLLRHIICLLGILVIMKCTTKKAAFDSSDINQYHETVLAPDGKPARIAHVVQPGNVIDLRDALGPASVGTIRVRRKQRLTASWKSGHHTTESVSPLKQGMSKKRADDAVPRLMSRLLGQKHTPSSLRGSFHQHDFCFAPFL